MTGGFHILKRNNHLKRITHYIDLARLQNKNENFKNAIGAVERELLANKEINIYFS